MDATIRKCPLCGSEEIRLIEPDPFQTRAGVSYVLKCECGAIVAMTVLKESKGDPQPKPDDVTAK
jgi:hypothetical protein